MANIEVGEYVRLTRNQGINRIIEVEIDEDEKRYILDDNIADEYGEETCYLFENEIKDEVVKHSKQLIDLIEVGDIVNGKLIHKIDKGSNYCYLYYDNCKTFVDYQIKTILTKEQFYANCYKVGGKDE